MHDTYGGAAASETLIVRYTCTIGGCSTPQKQPRENTVQNSVSFVETVKELRTGPPGWFRCDKSVHISTDHSSPQVIEEKLAGDQSSERRTNISVSHLVELVELCP